MWNWLCKFVKAHPVISVVVGTAVCVAVGGGVGFAVAAKLGLVTVAKGALITGITGAAKAAVITGSICGGLGGVVGVMGMNVHASGLEYMEDAEKVRKENRKVMEENAKISQDSKESKRKDKTAGMESKQKEEYVSAATDRVKHMEKEMQAQFEKNYKDYYDTINQNESPIKSSGDDQNNINHNHSVEHENDKTTIDTDNIVNSHAENNDPKRNSAAYGDTAANRNGDDENKGSIISNNQHTSFSTHRIFNIAMDGIILDPDAIFESSVNHQPN